MNDFRVTSDPLLPFTLSLAVLLFLTGLFFWLETKKQAPYPFLRKVSLILMMIALAGYLFRPLYKTKASRQLILLTPRYNPLQVDSLLKLYPDLTVLHTSTADPHRNSTAVGSYHDLSTSKNLIAFILGQGLSPAILDLLGSQNFRFIPAAYPQGIIRLAIPDRIYPNRKSTVEGIYHGALANSKIFLSGPAGKEDSVSFSGEALQQFKLSFVPKVPGNFIYEIYSGDSLYGRLPVTVQKERALNILFVQDYPTFETHYLKEYLADQHHLVLRTRLSQDKYRYEFINHKSVKIQRLTKGSLLDFDLIIIDSDALQSMPRGERNDLQSAIEEGLGMVTLFNSSPSGLRNLLPFNFEPYRSDTAHVNPKGQKKQILPAWSYRVLSTPALTSTLENKNRILSGYFSQGFGKTGFQLLQQTYRLMLQGDSAEYAAIWSPLLEQLSRREKAEFVLHKKTGFPVFTDEPVHFEIISSGRTPVALVNNIPIPLKENVLIDDVWQATVWAGKQGWEKFAVEGDSAAIDFFVSDKNEWSSLAIAGYRDETKKAGSSTLQGMEQDEIHVPVPQWIFYVLFLLSAGFLWLTPKL
jgi:hypothetical protein